MRRRDERGVIGTLDSLVGSVLGTLVLGALLTFWIGADDRARISVDETTAATGSTQVVDRVARHVESGRVVTAEPHVLVLAVGDEWVRYAVEEDRFVSRSRPITGDPRQPGEWTTGTSKTITVGVSDDSGFAYYDAVGGLLPQPVDPATVKRVQVVVHTPGERGTVTARSETAVADLPRLPIPVRVPDCPPVTVEPDTLITTLTWPRVEDATQYEVLRDGAQVALVKDAGQMTLTWTGSSEPDDSWRVLAYGPAGVSECGF